MNRTLTRQGARRLREWIGAPLGSARRIRERQECVRHLISAKGAALAIAARYNAEYNTTQNSFFFGPTDCPYTPGSPCLA